MNGVVAAIYSSFFLGISQIALKKAYRRLSPSVSFFYDAILGLLMWIPLALVMGITRTAIFQTFPYALLSGILSEAFYFWAISKGKLSIAAALINSYPIYTIFFSYFINQERLNQYQWGCIFLAIGGTLLLSLPTKLVRTELKKVRTIIWPILAAMAVGLSDSLSKHVINQTASAFSFLFTLALVQVPIALIYLRIEKQQPLTLIRKTWAMPQRYKYPLMASLFNIVGTGLLWISFQYTLASIASPITATGTVFVVLFGILFLNEKIRLRDTIGMVLLFSGVFGISGNREKK